METQGRGSCFSHIECLSFVYTKYKGEEIIIMGILLFTILVILLISLLPTWPYSSRWGYYPSGGIGTILLILLIFWLLGIF